MSDYAVPDNGQPVYFLKNPKKVHLVLHTD